MRGAGVIALQIPAASVVLTVICGLIGFLAAHFTGWGDAATGFGWEMIIGGGVVGFAVGSSGSPSENLVRGRAGQMGTYWGQSAALPQSPLQFGIAGCLAFAFGIVLIVLTYP